MHSLQGRHAPPVDGRRFVESLAQHALAHRAVRHPYLFALGEEALPDVRWALRDFARQYLVYSRAFPQFLGTVTQRLSSRSHRAALERNLAEESGSYAPEELDALVRLGVDPDWIVGIRHPVLFERFAASVGVRGGEPDLPLAARWRDDFLGLLTSGSEATAVGALGLGTELIVSTIYRPIVNAVDGVGLAPRDTVFFLLHTCIDDDHQATLAEIATDLASTEDGRRELLAGMLQALELRARFWDGLLLRALGGVRTVEGGVHVGA